MLKDKINIQDSLMTILLNKEYKKIQMNEILKKSKLKSKKSFLYYKNKEEIPHKRVTNSVKGLHSLTLKG